MANLVELTSSGTGADTFSIGDNHIIDISVDDNGSRVTFVDQATGLRDQVLVTGTPAANAAKSSVFFLVNRPDATTIYLNSDRVVTVSVLTSTTSVIYYDNEGSQAERIESSDTYASVTSTIQSTSGVQRATVTIPTAEVLTLNATPVELVPAPGAGKSILVHDASLVIDFNSAAYATQTTVNIGVNGADAAQAVFTNGLNATADKSVKAAITSSTGASDEQLPANAALEASVPTANPTAGDSDITIEVFYSIVDSI